MNNELQNIAAALKRLESAGASEDAKRTQAMTTALNAISAALTDLVSVAEDKDKSDDTAAAEMIADAIMAIRIPAPEVRVEPTINVAAPNVTMPDMPLVLTVQAGANHNHVTVPPSEVTVMPAPEWKSLKVSFDYRGGNIVSATINRE